MLSAGHCASEHVCVSASSRVSKEGVHAMCAGHCASEQVCVSASAGVRKCGRCLCAKQHVCMSEQVCVLCAVCVCRALPVTARTLETIIRIATASCKISMRFAIKVSDVAVARSILDHCLRNNVGEVCTCVSVFVFVCVHASTSRTWPWHALSWTTVSGRMLVRFARAYAQLCMYLPACGFFKCLNDVQPAMPAVTAAQQRWLLYMLHKPIHMLIVQIRDQQLPPFAAIAHLLQVLCEIICTHC
jgi:hypothetical protein